MAVSSQRLILMLLAFNIVIGIAVDNYTSPTDYTDSLFENRINILQNHSDDARILRTSAAVTTIDYGEQESIMDKAGRSMQIFNLFLTGFTLPVRTFITEKPIEGTIIQAVALFSLLINILAMFELYLIFKNAKAS